MYAYMQAVGMVDDHMVGCFCAKGAKLKRNVVDA
jgi:3-methyladenine DNA glycosylase Tag